jgi:hypothetical protein
MRFPVALRGSRPASQSESRACGTGLAMRGSVPPPSAAPDDAGPPSYPAFPRPASGHGECSGIALSCSWQPSQCNPCQHRDAEGRRADDGSNGRPASARAVSRHADWHRSRPATAGFHGRRRASCVSSHFFPRSVGFGPTASRASGAFTIAPSMLCHDQAIPSISSYSAKPRRHSFVNTPQRFHSRKYPCTELALPYSFGKAFHWHPVRSTYTIASNTRRGCIRFRPPPGRRLYLRPLSRRCFGISGARSHRASDTVQDLMKAMHHTTKCLS